jgi:hypothetical protein
MAMALEITGRLLYSVNEVAALTSQSRAQINRDLASGLLISCKKGRRRLITARQLAEYTGRIEAGTVG